ncbi:hypothetical protein MTBBW1_2450002 [Desulfamplus magnetovallimortis]|uniref:Fibronectin type-III domain-containing protein n=1 Tax=Desulfamplus magnetovallimortis TaxID=1246637 RepID=A0A1W1HEK8_9BACT|nr:two-component regulator propeller domain-containing protein [Desulfamplus magnetovallimortis]SLM30812.1 hypothetical protein MTBBW1_2450002 [Desulfamplus magnetovallimortis]
MKFFNTAGPIDPEYRYSISPPKSTEAGRRLWQKVFPIESNVKMKLYCIISILLWILTVNCDLLGNELLHISKERQNWELITNRSEIRALLISDDKTTLWIATTGGLEERDANDGRLKKLFSNQDGLPKNLVTSLLSDDEGGIWVGTWGSGLGHLKSNGTWEIFNNNNSGLHSNIVTSLLSDDQGGIWVGTYDSGLVHMSLQGTWDIVNTYNSVLPNNWVTSLLSGGQSSIWVGTYNGFAHLKADGTGDVFNSSNSVLPDNWINSVLSDEQGNLWVGTWGGLVRLKPDGTGEVFNKYNSGLPGNYVGSLISDNQGGIWIANQTYNDAISIYGTDGNLVHMRADGTWEVFNEENSDLPDNFIASLLSDGQGGFWTGTYNGGLAHLKTDGTSDLFYENNSGLPGKQINSLLSDNQGGLWVSTVYGGLGHLQSDDSWEIFNKKNSALPDDIVTSLLSDGQGGIWMGTMHDIFDIKGRLSHLKSENTWEIFDLYTSFLSNDWVSSLLSDNQGSIWIGTTENGLAHLKSDETWEIFNKNNSNLPGDYVCALLSDNEGGIWAGTSENGLAHLQSDATWEIFNKHNSGLPDDHVISLLTDGQNGIWVGTHDGAVNLRSDGTWNIFNVFDEATSGLSDNNVTSLLSDHQKGIWVGTWGGGLAHLRSDGTLEVLHENNSDLPDNFITSLLHDGLGGIWMGAGQLYSTLAHLLLIGFPEQIIKHDKPDITMTWFLKNAPFDYQNVQFIELQRALSKTGLYETVRDISGNPVRFYVDYSDCPYPRVDKCWPAVQGHTPAYQGEGDTRIKGYTLDITITDPEWLEGLPRYYRLSAVIEENGALVRVANNSESTFMAPAVEENPRIDLSLERSAIALSPGNGKDITLFVSSIDLYTGEIKLETSLVSENPDGINIRIDPATVTLKPGETVPVLLHVDISPETANTSTNNTASTIQINPETSSGNQFKSTALTVYTGTEPMAALSIAHTTKRPRVMDGITVSGNIVSAQNGQEVNITGKNAVSNNEIEPLTVLTDDKGFFQGSIFPENSGNLILTAQSAGVTSNNAEIFILPAKNHIALTSNVNQGTSQRDILTIEGIITPVRPSETSSNPNTNSGTESRLVNLDVRYLDPDDSESGLQPQFVGNVDVDENGKFSKEIVVPGEGFINVNASLPETPDFLGIETKLVIPIGQPVGEGIIVVSESGTQAFQEISKSLGKYVYNTLQTRNIPSERIRYLGGADDESSIPVDGFADKSNLHHALTEWAVSLMSTEDPYKTPLNLYLIGDVEDGNFELLTAGDLASYLDEAESLISDDKASDTKGFPVTIILEGSQSESWIDKIAGKGRIILTSSSAKPLDQGGYSGYDNLGESSFSRYFYQFINYGSDIEGSFAEANYEILKFYRHTQRPVMDADGDGVGTTKYDRYEASGKFIEYRPSGNLRPEVRATNPDMTVNIKNATKLWAIATDPEIEMYGVFCSITDPSGRTENMELQRDHGDMYIGDFYPADSGSGNSVGCHQIVYYAKDKAGNVSLPVEKFVNVVSGGSLPDDNTPDKIPNAPEFAISIEGSIVSISWENSSSDIKGYTLFYAPYPDAEYIGQFEMGMERSITFDGAGMAFYCAIKACNDMGCSDYSNIEWFDL